MSFFFGKRIKQRDIKWNICNENGIVWPFLANLHQEDCTAE